MSNPIKKRTQEDRELLKNKTVYSLPDNPSNKGFSASQLKSKIADPTLLLFDWFSELTDESYALYNDLCALLESGLAEKQDTLVSGENIKTINNSSILSSGNLSLQETLESGVNIKKINGEDILGSGNITVTASSRWGGIVGNISEQSDLQTELNKKQNNLTFDNKPTNGSQNPVTSDGIYDSLQDVREVAEGKTQTYILSDRITRISGIDGLVYYLDDQEQEQGAAIDSLYVYNSSTKAWETISLTYELDSLSIVNTSFNSENSSIGVYSSANKYVILGSIGGGSYYLLCVYNYDEAISRFPIKKGDVFLVIETKVPDRWFDGDHSFYKLETSKVDLSSCVDLTSPQTITGVKTIQNELDFKYDNNSTSLWKLKAGGDYSFGFEKDNASLLSYITTQGFGFNGDVYSQNNQDLGKSTSKWKDLYLSGIAYIGSSGYVSGAYGNISIGFGNNNNKVEITTTNAKYDENIIPWTTNTYNLGSTSAVWSYLYVNNLSNGTGTLTTHCDLLPSASNALDLGSGTYKFKDLYLSGTVDIHNANTTYGYTILENDYSNLEINFNGARKFAINNNNGCECRNTFHPGANDTYDLGETDHAWRDAYLTRKSYFAEDGVTHTLAERNWYVYHNQYNELIIGRTYNSIAADKIGINGGTIYTKDNNGNLGSTSNKWKDLYLSGNLTDGTKEVPVNEIATNKEFTPTSCSISFDPDTISITLAQADYADIIANQYEVITLKTSSVFGFDLTLQKQSSGNVSGTYICGYFGQVDAEGTVYYISIAFSNSAVIDAVLVQISNDNCYTKTETDQLISTLKQNSFQDVNTTTYPTLNDFLASTGVEGYIYLYPIDTSDLTKGYHQYIWESSSWRSLGNTTIDLNNYVDLSSTQTITGEKTVRDLALSASASYDANKWYIRGWGASGLDIGLRGENKGIKIQEGSVTPLTTNVTDLGSSSNNFKDLYLSGGAYFGVDDIETDANNYLVFKVNGATRLTLFTGTEARVNGNLTPQVSETYDLGSSSLAWKDLYLSGNIDFGNNAKIQKDSSDRVCLIAGNDTKVKIGNDTLLKGRFIPDSDDSYDLGYSSSHWRDLYLSRNLTDGTNSFKVSELSFRTVLDTALDVSDISVDQQALFQRGFVIRNTSGTFGGLDQDIVIMPAYEYSTTWRGIYISGTAVGSYLLNVSAHTLSFGSSTDLGLKNVASFNNKAVPAYPSSPANAKVLTYGTNNQLSWEDAGSGGNTITIERYI